MTNSSQSRNTLLTAMLCSAAVMAEFVGGKATRDALLLTFLHITALPTMLIAAAICSILLVAAQTRWAGKIAPATLVPALFGASGFLFLAEWCLRVKAPTAAAVIVYLHVSGAGPLLASGFWLIAGDRFDPHTAKRRFGQIAGAGTLGGLLGAVLAERVAVLVGVAAMLPFLAAFQFLAAWLIRRLAVSAPATAGPAAAQATNPIRLGTGLRAARAPHLRHLMTLVLLGTTSAALLDYLFKARAVEAFGAGDSLLRFFALYYGTTSAITFALQLVGSRVALDRLGLALTTSTPSIALIAGSLGDLVVPGLGGVMLARGGESIFRGSWFRAGYELFYTPIPAAEKRAAKPVIDVIADRLGDAVGGGLIRLAVVFVPLTQSQSIISVAILCSVGAIVAASHLNRWHLRTLESSLLSQAGPVGPLETDSGQTARLILSVHRRTAQNKAQPATQANVIELALDPLVQDVLSLRSTNRRRVLEVLAREEGMAAGLVPHVISLLASDTVGCFAVFALRKVAEERVGELADALLDPTQPYVVRRRLARVFSVCCSQRAAEVLSLALEDARFGVRFQAARSLIAIVDRNAQIRIDRARIEEVVLKEVAVGRPIWKGRRLLDGLVSESPLDEFVRDRASQSLAHVFTLLSLVLPREPLQIAFQSLHSEDERLQGTALEYLDTVLPARIRRPLWPFLFQEPSTRPPESRDAIVAGLVQASASVTLLDIMKHAEPSQTAGFAHA